MDGLATKSETLGAVPSNWLLISQHKCRNCVANVGRALRQRRKIWNIISYHFQCLIDLVGWVDVTGDESNNSLYSQIDLVDSYKHSTKSSTTTWPYHKLQWTNYVPPPPDTLPPGEKFPLLKSIADDEWASGYYEHNLINVFHTIALRFSSELS